jgi:hypothetical protein
MQQIMACSGFALTNGRVKSVIYKKCTSYHDDEV